MCTLTRWIRGSVSNKWVVSGRLPWTCGRWPDALSCARLPAFSWAAYAHETLSHSQSCLLINTSAHTSRTFALDCTDMSDLIEEDKNSPQRVIFLQFPFHRTAFHDNWLSCHNTVWHLESIRLFYTINTFLATTLLLFLLWRLRKISDMCQIQD